MLVGMLFLLMLRVHASHAHAVNVNHVIMSIILAMLMQLMLVSRTLPDHALPSNPHSPSTVFRVLTTAKDMLHVAGPGGSRVHMGEPSGCLDPHTQSFIHTYIITLHYVTLRYVTLRYITLLHHIT